MAKYRFHCTNGLECVLDATGGDIRAPDRLTGRARRVAERVMRSGDMGSPDGPTDWSQWHVSVHDLKGRRVLVQPFVPRARDAAPLAA